MVYLLVFQQYKWHLIPVENQLNLSNFSLFGCLELTLLDVCMSAKCFSNQSVALKVLNDGGVYVNHKKLSNPHAILVFGVHILPNMITVLRIGKNRKKI